MLLKASDRLGCTDNARLRLLCHDWTSYYLLHSDDDLLHGQEIYQALKAKEVHLEAQEEVECKVVAKTDKEG